MQSILEILKASSPVVAIIIIIGYFIKIYIERKIDSFHNIIENIKSTSLDIKKDLRTEERTGLVELREVLVEWEDFLQNAIFSYSINNYSDDSLPKIIDTDQKLFLKVKMSIVKFSIYLRSEELENTLSQLVLEIRKTYYPLINDFMPKLIELKTQLGFYEFKLNKFKESGLKDMTYAPTEEDRKNNLRLQELLTEEDKKFAEALTASYTDIAVLLKEIKAIINKYVYRPITKSDIDKA